MGALGDLAEALLLAPRLRTLHATGTLRVDLEAMAELMEAEGAGVDRIVMGQVGMVPEATDVRVELWFEATAPSRWRVDQRGATTIATGDHVFHPFGEDVVRKPRGPDGESFPDALRPIVRGSELLAGFRPELPVRAEAAGRSAWVVAGPRQVTSRFGGWEAWRRGDRLEIVVDEASGVVLGYRALHGDVLLSDLTLEVVAVDEAIDPAIFDPTPRSGGRIVDEAELIEEMRSRRPPGPTLEDLAAAHVPHGPGPDDERAATMAIAFAFTRMLEVSEDGSALPHVEGGSNLGPPYHEARERFAGVPKAEVAVLNVKFVDRDEAVVWFDIAVPKGPGLKQVEGRAVLTPDGWKVSRPTLARLLQGVGIALPPPPP